MEESKKAGTKRKYTTTFTPDCAAIGKYAAENGNAEVVKKFKATYSIGEGTVRLDKRRYQEKLKKQHTAVSVILN